MVTPESSPAPEQLPHSAVYGFYVPLREQERKGFKDTDHCRIVPREMLEDDEAINQPELRKALEAQLEAIDTGEAFVPYPIIDKKTGELVRVEVRKRALIPPDGGFVIKSSRDIPEPVPEHVHTRRAQKTGFNLAKLLAGRREKKRS